MWVFLSSHRFPEWLSTPQSSAGSLGREWMLWVRTAVEKQQREGRGGDHSSYLPTLGPCSPLWVIPNCNSTLSATEFVHMSVSEPLPYGLVVQISTICSTFRFYSLTLLSCCVLSQGQPSSQRPRGILRPALGVDRGRSVTVEQGWYRNRKSGVKLSCKSPRVRAGLACPSTPPSSADPPDLVWTTGATEGGEETRGLVVGDSQYRMPLCWCLDCTSSCQRGVVKLHKLVLLDDLLLKLDPHVLNVCN